MIETIVDTFRSFKDNLCHGTPNKRKFSNISDDESLLEEPCLKRRHTNTDEEEPLLARSDQHFVSKNFFTKMRSWIFPEFIPSPAKITKERKDDVRFVKRGDSVKLNSAITKTKLPHITNSTPKVDPVFQFNPTVTSTVSRKILHRKKNFTGSAIVRRKSEQNLLGLYKKRPPSSFMKSIKKAKLPSSTNLHSVVRDCYRLDDRFKYKQLLQQYTESSASSFRSSQKSKLENAKKCGAIVQKMFDSLWTKQHAEEIAQLKNKCDGYKNKSHTEIDLTASDEVDKTKSEPKSSKIQVTQEEDDEIQVTKEILQESPPHHNSLELCLAKSPAYTFDGAKERKEKYAWRKAQHDRAVEALIEEKRQLKAIRESNQKVLEDKIARRIAALDITYPKRIYDIKPEKNDLIPLTDEMKNIINRCIRGDEGAVICEKFNIQIHRRDIITLTDLKWLNDEVINFYMNMLLERSKEGEYVNIYTFNTFFYPKLVTTGYSSIKRWTRKVDIFSHELLIIPVHLKFHWCLATVDFRDKTIRFYDSMHMPNNECLNELMGYLHSEHEDKKKSPFDGSNWTLENVRNIPKQRNGSDCGVFLCKFSEYLSRDAKITFTQENMPYFRMRMIYEIFSKRLL